MTKTLISLGLALVVLATGAACKPEGRHAAPPPAPGRHRQQPAPNPDPAPSRSGIGSVLITFVVETSNNRATVTYNAGSGYKNVIARRPASHWDERVQPGQRVAIVATHFNLGESGRIFVQIYQHNNGRVVCQDSNSGHESSGASCDGVIVI